MKENQLMVNPILSSVLYLTGDFKHTTTQAPTVVTNQAFDHTIGEPVPENPTSSTFVFPLRNSYCVFDGALGHGVLDCGNDSQRATLLINWWEKKPENIERLRRHVDDGRSTFAVEKKTSEVNTLRMPECIYPIEVDIQPILRGSTNDGGDDEGDGVVLVDDVLKEYGVDIAVQPAVTVHHEGMMLYPIEREQLKEICAMVGGAFGNLDDEQSE